MLEAQTRDSILFSAKTFKARNTQRKSDQSNRHHAFKSRRCTKREMLQAGIMIDGPSTLSWIKPRSLFLFVLDLRVLSEPSFQHDESEERISTRVRRQCKIGYWGCIMMVNVFMVEREGEAKRGYSRMILSVSEKSMSHAEIWSVRRFLKQLLWGLVLKCHRGNKTALLA